LDRSSAYSARNASSAQASRKWASRSASAGTSVSGAKRPPYSPKRPSPSGSGPGGSRCTAVPRRGTDIRTSSGRGTEPRAEPPWGSPPGTSCYLGRSGPGAGFPTADFHAAATLGPPWAAQRAHSPGLENCAWPSVVELPVEGPVVATDVLAVVVPLFARQ